MKIAVLSKLLLVGSGFALITALLAPPRLSQDVYPPPLEHIAALLLVIGCHDDLSQCREMPTPVSVFETKEDCDQQLPNALGALTEEFEQLFGQCLLIDPAVDEEDARLVWEVLPDGTLVSPVTAAPSETTEPLSAMIALDHPG